MKHHPSQFLKLSFALLASATLPSLSYGMMTDLPPPETSKNSSPVGSSTPTGSPSNLRTIPLSNNEQAPLLVGFGGQDPFSTKEEEEDIIPVKPAPQPNKSSMKVKSWPLKRNQASLSQSRTNVKSAFQPNPKQASSTKPAPASTSPITVPVAVLEIKEEKSAQQEPKDSPASFQDTAQAQQEPKNDTTLPQQEPSKVEVKAKKDEDHLFVEGDTNAASEVGEDEKLPEETTPPSGGFDTTGLSEEEIDKVVKDGDDMFVSKAEQPTQETPKDAATASSQQDSPAPVTVNPATVTPATVTPATVKPVPAPKKTTYDDDPAAPSQGPTTSFLTKEEKEELKNPRTKDDSTLKRRGMTSLIEKSEKETRHQSFSKGDNFSPLAEEITKKFNNLKRRFDKAKENKEKKQADKDAADKAARKAAADKAAADEAAKQAFYRNSAATVFGLVGAGINDVFLGTKVQAMTSHKYQQWAPSWKAFAENTEAKNWVFLRKTLASLGKKSFVNEKNAGRAGRVITDFVVGGTVGLVTYLAFPRLPWFKNNP